MAPILPWIAHLYTATGAVWALVATAMTVAHEFRAAFVFLAVATFVDATDGLLARALRVKERLPGYDGGKLDDIVDYLTYVFVPVLIVWQAGLVAAPLPVGAAILIASAYGFGQVGAKVDIGDHYFTGFPSYWNIVVLYLYVLRLPQAVNAAILLVLAVLVFVPIRYLYPSRTRTMRGPTLALGVLWAAAVIWMIWRLPDTGGPWTALSFIFPIWYTGLSLWLHVRR